MEIFWVLIAAAVFCLIASMIEFFIDKKPPVHTSAMPMNKRRNRRHK